MKSDSAWVRIKPPILAAIVLALSTIGVLAPPRALAQVARANVGGVVTDQTGARLPGVTVTVTNSANGTSQVLVTGVEGHYRAVALQPAPYEIVAELAGFAPVRRSLTLTVGADATVDFQLTVATLQETVTVSSGAPVIEVSQSQQSSMILPEQVQALPNLGRNFLELAQLMPGAGPDNSRTQYFNPTKFGGVGDQRNGFTTLIDGGDVDDVIWGSTTMNFTQEAVQEFKVFRNQFDAEYGNALAAVVTVVSKSGTNEVSGSAFYFGRDRALNAKNAFATEKPPFDQQRYGGSIGGPIVRNRTHFFGAYEYSNLDTVKIIALPATNPFAAEQNGTFGAGADNHLADAKVNHRFNDQHQMSVRYAYDNQKLLRTQNVSSDSNQIDEYSRTHSIVADEGWILSQRMVNTVRFHYLKQNVGNTPYSLDLSVSRPSVTTGQSGISPQFFPRTRKVISDTLYINAANHDLKFGGDLAFASTQFESHFNEHGGFNFTTDAPFVQSNPATWPISFIIGQPGLRSYDSKQIALFAQDTWRVGSRVTLNLGIRYDLDTNLRNNDFYASVIDNPMFAGIENFISKDRGNDFNNLQPRVGATWDIRGDAKLVMRGGYGYYVTRNRPWFQLFSMNSFLGNSVTIQDPQLLQFYPDINAVLGGKTLEDYIAAGGARSVFAIPDDSVLPYSLNATVGVGWQLNSVSTLDVDYVHDVGDHQLGGRDLNLPESGAIGPSNPRPVSGFTSVTLMQNFTKTWYDALETQLRTRYRKVDNILVSYTLSRSYRDGVNFYGTLRGTQRTPHERGYNDTDQRHNLTVSAAGRLPWAMQLSGIGKFISGSPILAQAGFDLDGDIAVTNDRPVGLPTRVGREKVEESLQIINDLRASRGLPPISRDLLNLDVFVSIDTRLTKDVNLGANRRLQLFFEVYNLTNHVNYQPFTINTNIISSSFLIRNSARDGRQAQWGVRYLF
ncbi:MAG TPA: TonB-dependent receptor [Vicinamibacterales bacterium]|nr:TonB-dependent receptor [Vicinamibacterales bacterium]